MKVCFKNPVTGEQVCFFIPVLINRWPPFDPLGRLIDLKNGPVPDPWITGKSIRPEVASNLQALASIHALSALLPEGPREAVQAVIRGQIGSIDLPGELQVNFDH